jgi:hypothetical protein
MRARQYVTKRQELRESLTNQFPDANQTQASTQANVLREVKQTTQTKAKFSLVSGIHP